MSIIHKPNPVSEVFSIQLGCFGAEPLETKLILKRYEALALYISDI